MGGAAPLQPANPTKTGCNIASTTTRKKPPFPVGRVDYSYGKTGKVVGSVVGSVVGQLTGSESPDL